MGKIENDELRKIKNANFMKAFKHVASKLKMNQGQLAEAIGSKSAYISNFSKGIRPVPEETIDALITISATIPGGQIFKEYLHGNSDIMLLANVTEEEMAEAMLRSANPDYDQLKARQESKWKEVEDMMNAPAGQPTPSSVFNANLAQQAESVEAFRMALASKDETIKEKNERILELKDALTEKDARIENLKELVAQLRADLTEAKAIIASYNSGQGKWPFNMGAAEGDGNKKERKRI